MHERKFRNRRNFTLFWLLLLLLLLSSSSSLLSSPRRCHFRSVNDIELRYDVLNMEEKKSTRTFNSYIIWKMRFKTNICHLKKKKIRKKNFLFASWKKNSVHRLHSVCNVYLWKYSFVYFIFIERTGARTENRNEK